MNKAACQAVTAGFNGLEGNADISQAHRDELQSVLQNGGGYVPRRQATVEEHIADVERQLQPGRSLAPQWVSIIGGCDAWPLEQSVRFFGEVQELAARINIACGFETHRSRSLFSPWQKAVSALLAGSVFWGLFWWPLKPLSMFGIQGGIAQV